MPCNTTDVLAAIKRATAEDLALIQAAVDDRRTALTHTAATVITPGQNVTLRDATPTFLNGLTGTVTSLTRNDAVGPTAAVLLDPRSTGTLRFSGRSEYRVPTQADRYELEHVPLDCLSLDQPMPTPTLGGLDPWDGPA